MPRRRLGVVLLVPASHAAEVNGLRRACGDGMLERVPPHLTLVPPVNVREDALPTALARVRAAAAGGTPLTLTLGPPVTFAPVSPVVYLEVGGPPAVVEGLHALRDRVFQPPLDRPLTHSFVPHVTLADEMAEARIDAALAALAGYRAEVEFRAVHVLEEQADRTWALIADAPLAPAVIVGRGGLPLELTTSAVLDPEALALAAAEPVPEGAEPLVVTARREGGVVGVAQGWTAATSGQVTAVTVAEEAADDEIDRHLLAELRSQAADRGATLA